MIPTDHYIPKQDDLPNLAERLENYVTKPVIRLGKISYFEKDNPPFHVVATSWAYPNYDGPLTKERLLDDLAGGVKSLAVKLDELSEDGNIKAYPMSWKPKVVDGVGYLDFATLRVDVRLVVKYGFIEEVDDHGLSFHVVTLLGKENNGTRSES